MATGNATGFFVGNGAQIKDCAATGNTPDFLAANRSHLSNWMATVNTGDGLQCTSYVTIIDGTLNRNGSNGIVVQSSSTVTRCNFSRNLPSGNGIRARN